MSRVEIKNSKKEFHCIVNIFVLTWIFSLAHPLIFDVNDNTELMEIRRLNAISLPARPYNVSLYMDRLEAASISGLKSKLNELSTDADTDCKRMQDS